MVKVDTKYQKGYVNRYKLVSFEVFVKMWMSVSLFWDMALRHMQEWWCVSRPGRFNPEYRAP